MPVPLVPGIPLRATLKLTQAPAAFSRPISHRKVFKPPFVVSTGTSGHVQAMLLHGAAHFWGHTSQKVPGHSCWQPDCTQQQLPQTCMWRLLLYQVI